MISEDIIVILQFLFKNVVLEQKHFHLSKLQDSFTETRVIRGTDTISENLSLRSFFWILPAFEV